MGDLVHVMKVTNEIFKRHIPSVDVRQTRVAQKIIKKVAIGMALRKSINYKEIRVTLLLQHLVLASREWKYCYPQMCPAGSEH